jgi:dTDP-4-amino-4,6-dideoxygalactose transaminase
MPARPDSDVPFNRPYVVGTEFAYIREAIDSGVLSGNGAFGRRCAEWLERDTGAVKALMTPSCTAALELSALLLDLGPGDEVIMPSFTFVTTASAYASRGAVPVFVDVREDTLNIDPDRLEAAITPRTKAIVVVHYAGVGADMKRIMAIARAHGLAVVEDAAQGIRARLHGMPLGGIGQLGTLSFHETKNVHCGEGGALLVNDPVLVERAEILQEKGTDRARFFRGQVDKYTWIDVGSSYLLSEINAAFLWAQLEHAEQLIARRLEIWRRYHAAFAELEAQGVLRLPHVPAGAEHNAHLFHLLLPNLGRRNRFIADLKDSDVHAVFHYVPLHSSPAGQAVGRPHGPLDVTDRVSNRLVRLPLWVGMTDDDVEHVIDASMRALDRRMATVGSRF